MSRWRDASGLLKAGWSPGRRGAGRSRAVARIVGASRVGREVADLDALAQVVGEELNSERCRITLGDPVHGPWHVWRRPAGQIRVSELRVDDPGPNGGPGAPGDGEQLFEVGFAGEIVGHLGLIGPLDGPGRAGLLRDVLVVLGAVLHSASLAGALLRTLESAVASADALAGARRRAVADMDTQRQTLERDLHDGAQHHLVTLKLLVGMLEHEVRTGVGNNALRARLDSVGAQLERTDRVLRRTAAGTLPVTLVAHGLTAALTSELSGQLGVKVDVSPGLVDRRYPAAIESVVYFACLEGVNNARRHAPGASVTVNLRDDYRGLVFSVRDDGPGFDLESVVTVSGLGHLRDRIGGVGGSVSIRSSPGHGTVIDGVIPV